MKIFTTTKLDAMIGAGLGLIALGAIFKFVPVFQDPLDLLSRDGAGSDSTTKSPTLDTSFATENVELGEPSSFTFHSSSMLFPTMEQYDAFLYGTTSTLSGDERTYRVLASGEDDSCIVYVLDHNGDLIDILAAEQPEDFSAFGARYVGVMARDDQELDA